MLALALRVALELSPRCAESLASPSRATVCGGRAPPDARTCTVRVLSRGVWRSRSEAAQARISRRATSVKSKDEKMRGMSGNCCGVQLRRLHAPFRCACARSRPSVAERLPATLSRQISSLRGSRRLLSSVSSSSWLANRSAARRPPASRWPCVSLELRNLLPLFVGDPLSRVDDTFLLFDAVAVGGLLGRRKRRTGTGGSVRVRSGLMGGYSWGLGLGCLSRISICWARSPFERLPPVDFSHELPAQPAGYAVVNHCLGAFSSVERNGLCRTLASLSSAPV